MLKRKCGQTLNGDARKIILNAIIACEEEKLRGDIVENLNKPLARVSHYTGVSLSTVKRIKREFMQAKTKHEETFLSENPDIGTNEVETLSPANMVFESPGRHKCKERFKKIDGFHQGVIRRTVSNFYMNEKPSAPSINKLHSSLKEAIQFPYSQETLRLLLQNMGYYWRTIGNGTKRVLVEKNEHINWRRQFIEKIRKFRSENRPVFYIDETWLDSSNTEAMSKKCFVLVHACSENGLLVGAELLYRMNVTTGEYHGQMNDELFQKYVQEKLLPNLPPRSVIVMDNASHHVVETDKTPSQFATKQTMKKWLTKHEIAHREEMNRAELYALIDAADKAEAKIYKVDELVRRHNHDVLRLPPCMGDLNLIELVWNKIKENIKECLAGNADVSAENLKEIIRQSIDSVSPVDCQSFMQKVITLEDYYYQFDPILEDKVDEVISSMGGDVNSTQDYSMDGSHDKSLDYTTPTNHSNIANVNYQSVSDIANIEYSSANNHDEEEYTVSIAHEGGDYDMSVAHNSGDYTVNNIGEHASYTTVSVIPPDETDCSAYVQTIEVDQQRRPL